MYDSIVFDMDGVLLRPPSTSAERYATAAWDTFHNFDENPPKADINAFYGESKSLDEMKQICEDYDIDFEDFWVKREQRFSAVQQQMIEHGERELYDDCTVLSTLAQTLDLGLVSTNQHETVEFVVDHFGLNDYFEAVYGRQPTVEGFERIKPDPYYLEQALRDLNTTSALYVGDSMSDLVAADRAELDSVFIWRDHRSNYNLTEDPTYEIDQLTDLPDILPY